jgi:uncharacterized protein (TIGR02453 family)
MSKQAFFDDEFFRFFREISRNNKKEWFLANKERYETRVKKPLVDFALALAPKLKKVAPKYVSDAKSVFRIYRDTRFSRDKTPYKTHGALHFRHARGKDVHAPGFYLHLEPGNVFAGSGLWRPEPPVAAKIRKSIAKDVAGWKKVTKGLKLDGDRLARPPRGFPKDHAAIEDLKRKDFITGHEFDEDDAKRASFLDDYVDALREQSAFMAFLTRACGLKW